MKIKVSAILVIFGLALRVSCLAQDTVVGRDGRQVVLNPDGTWHYATNEPSISAGSALDTVRAYLSAPSWRDRSSLVLNPKRVKPLMESRYSGKRWVAPKFQLLTQTEPTPSISGWVKVEADVSGSITSYYLKHTMKGYRIDWESSVGFNPMSPEEFRATKPSKPIRFRIYAKLDDYYNYEFLGAKDIAYSIIIEDRNNNRLGHGYADKNSHIGQVLFNKLRDGNNHEMVLDVQCLPDAESGSVFVISRVVNLNGWLAPRIH